DPVIIQHGCSLRWGIMQKGSLASASLAEHFFLSEYSTLSKGARLIDSFISEISTFSCGVMISAFCGPFHEQHHNNTFLIAAALEGQSNMAAGVCLGSNHNTRSADGEILIHRGFWPGLMTSMKYNSRLASFCLITGGQFQYELDISLPFSLISQNSEELQIRPAYWQQYNLYALGRNSWKYSKRDKKGQWDFPMETYWLAPDTVEEITQGIKLLNQWINQGTYDAEKKELIVNNHNLEKSNRPLRIFKPKEALSIFETLLDYYLAITLINYQETEHSEDWTWLNREYIDRLSKKKKESWKYLGGSMISQSQLDEMIKDIESSNINSWQDIHIRYSKWHKEYPELKLIHALYIKDEDILKRLKNALQWEKELLAQTKTSRLKDIDSAFRQITFHTPQESEELLPDLPNDPFLNDLELLSKNSTVKIKELIEIFETE
ncbi:MAG: DUF4954 family protein, partial [Spirochaetaceae bacterium]|nr:DUF4954 family protein [Spirochaetaceae bacterium]